MVDTLPIGALTREIAGILKGRVGRYSIRQFDLERVFGVNQSQVSKILRGEKPITIDQVEAACYSLDLDFVQVMQEAWREAGGLDLPVPVFVNDGGKYAIPRTFVVRMTDAEQADELIDPDASPVGAYELAARQSAETDNSHASNDGGARGGSGAARS